MLQRFLDWLYPKAEQPVKTQPIISILPADGPYASSPDKSYPCYTGVEQALGGCSTEMLWQILIVTLQCGADDYDITLLNNQDEPIGGEPWIRGSAYGPPTFTLHTLVKKPDGNGWDDHYFQSPEEVAAWRTEFRDDVANENNPTVKMIKGRLKQESERGAIIAVLTLLWSEVAFTFNQSYRPSVNCNDTFYYASADAEEVASIEEVVLVLQADQRWPGIGHIGYCKAKRHGQKTLWTKAGLEESYEYCKGALERMKGK